MVAHLAFTLVSPDACVCRVSLRLCEPITQFRPDMALATFLPALRTFDLGMYYSWDGENFGFGATRELYEHELYD